MQASQNLVSSQINFSQKKQEEFLDLFFARKLWGEPANSVKSYNHPILGQIDEHNMLDQYARNIRGEKQYQLDNSFPANHRHASHRELPKYRQEVAQNLPKWLPMRVGVKTLDANQYGESIKRQVDDNINNFWDYSPEFARVLAINEDENNNKINIFYELQNSLEQDITQRRAENRPYSEELLWQLLFNLTRAAARLDGKGQSATDIRPSRINYNQYQPSILPYGTVPDRDYSLQSKFSGSEAVFYSIYTYQNFLDGSRLDNLQQKDITSKNESFQIGLTILCAGLLKTEREIVNDKKIENLEELIENFGAIYPQSNQLLRYTIEELFMDPSETQRTCVQIFRDFMEGASENYVFLEQELKNHLESQYSNNNNSLAVPRFNYRADVSNVDINFKRLYPAHYHQDIVAFDNAQLYASIERNNADVQAQLRAGPHTTTQTIRQSQTGGEHVKRSGHHTTTTHTTGVYGSQYQNPNPGYNVTYSEKPVQYISSSREEVPMRQSYQQNTTTYTTSEPMRTSYMTRQTYQ